MAMVVSGCAGGTDDTPPAAGGEDCGSVTLEVADSAPGQAWETGLIAWGERVSEATDGRVTVRLIPGGQLGGEIEMVAQVKQGNLAMTQVGAPGFTEFSPLFTAYLFDDAKVMDFAASDIMQGWKDAILEREGIRVLAVEYAPPRWITSQTPIETPEDLAGLKIRVPEIPSLVAAFDALGATAMALPWPDTYYALQTGSADGQENSAAVTDSGKIYEVQDYLAKTNHAQNFRYLLINEDTFQGICESDRALLEGEIPQLLTDQEEQLRAESDALVDGWVESGQLEVTEPDISEFVEMVGDAGSDVAEEAWGPGVLEQIREQYGPNS